MAQPNVNAALGNLGATVCASDPLVPAPAASDQPLGALVAELRAGAVETLVIGESNPAYTAPVEYGFAELIRGVPESICLDLYETETAHSCRWYAPAAHWLESWGDALAFEGTYSLTQPLIRPLLGGRQIVPRERVHVGAGAERGGALGRGPTRPHRLAANDRG